MEHIIKYEDIYYMSEWEIYKKPKDRTMTKKYISVTKSKTFGLPRPFIDAYNISKGDRAVLLYNPDENKIAIRFSKTGPDFGHKLRFGKGSSHGAIIVARKFFEDKGIDTDAFAGHYDDFEKVSMASLGFNAEGDAFVIQLKLKEPNPSSTSGEKATAVSEAIPSF